METRQLAKESQQRLNGFMDQLRGSVAVDLSAKNLGEEGTQYVSEALAFNDRCTTLTVCPGGSSVILVAVALHRHLQPWLPPRCGAYQPRVDVSCCAGNPACAALTGPAG